MSNLIPPNEIVECSAVAQPAPPVQALPSRSVHLGALEVRRLLPLRDRRMIGPWCFFDRFGPVSFIEEKVMDVAPHPHIGLQTVTWLFAGEVVHHDSLASECLVRPGQLSLMTAGRGIAHTEETPPQNSGRLDGIQLWVALPAVSRNMPPEYQCTREQAVAEFPGGLATAILGEFAGALSAGRLHSPGVGVDLTIHKGQRAFFPIQAGFEYGVLLVSGDAVLFDQRLERETMYYLGAGCAELPVSTRDGARLILIGGPPFPETVLMWWNFVARTPEEMAAARESWERHELFGEVRQYRGPRLAAPALPGRLLRSPT